MRIKLVTSILHYLHGDPYYGVEGRTRLERYMQSMLAIANTGHDIVLYINDPTLEEFKTYMEKHGVTNIEYKSFSIEQFKYHNKMQEIKSQTGEFKSYYEIGWAKIQMMEQEIDDSYDHLYWIDSGLSHYGLYPWKHNPNSDIRTEKSIDPNSYSFTGIYNPDLFPKIADFSQGLLINLENDMRFHQLSGILDIYNMHNNTEWLSVGGLMGGPMDAIQWFADEFFEFGRAALDINQIPNHEVVFGAVSKKHRDNFKTFRFSTWYHDDTPEVTRGEVNIDGLVQWNHFFEQL
jgi:hypothetical protein